MGILRKSHYLPVQGNMVEKCDLRDLKEIWVRSMRVPRCSCFFGQHKVTIGNHGGETNHGGTGQYKMQTADWV